ncbi:MAG: tetratricopeptide repeat protein [Planctomycetes bacterium]|nr:tetratricopeptide repeat protein [Planctomycetota bacterium]
MVNRGKSFSLFDMILSSFIIALFMGIFMFHISSECEAARRYKMVVLPFRDNTHRDIGEMVSDVLRSMVTQTNYFEAVERDKVYETVITMLPSNLINVDNIKRIGGGFTANQVDVISRLDRRNIQRFSKKLRADYVIKGSISEFAHALRVDAEIIDVRDNKMLGFVDIEGQAEDLLKQMLDGLTRKILHYCKSINSYNDALYIYGQYTQGLYTFGVAEKKLKELLSDLRDSVGIRAVLMTLYLSGKSPINDLSVQKDSSPGLGDKIIEEGEGILNLLQSSYDEKVLEVFLSTGLDPFKEVANIYVSKGNTEKAIEIYRNAINVYPINLVEHYKEIGKLYSWEGMDSEAIQAFEKALEINKSNNVVRLALAGLLKKSGFTERAQKHLEVCMKYARDSEEIERIREEINNLSASVHE